nr:MAG TPA: hypothetical protein [Herelleviridae sp.]
MQHIIYQTASLLRFLNTLSPTQVEVRRNLLDEQIGFVSRYYTPNLHMSELAQNVLYDIQNENVRTAEHDYNRHSIVAKIDKSELKLQEPKIYLILQTIILEAYAIVNCFVENPQSLKYLTVRDLSITRENLNYVADYLSDYDEYNSMVSDLRDLDICFGNIELQLPIIRKEVEYNEV